MYLGPILLGCCAQRNNAKSSKSARLALPIRLPAVDFGYRFQVRITERNRLAKILNDCRHVPLRCRRRRPHRFQARA